MADHTMRILIAVLLLLLTPLTIAQVITYPIEFTVTGLREGPTPGNPDYSVTLLNNDGDAISVYADGVFSFSTELPGGTSYDITIDSQPEYETCTVTNGSGTVAAAPVTDPLVTCVDNPSAPIPVLGTGGLAVLIIFILMMSFGLFKNRPEGHFYFSKK